MKKIGLLFVLLLLLTVGLAAVFLLPDLLPEVVSSLADQTEISTPEGGVVVAAAESLDETPLRDVDTLYAGDDPYDVVTMYLTVSYGNPSDGTNHTWEEVNRYSAYYYDDLGIDRYKVAALLQVGDESGPLPDELGYGLNVPNATVNIRGQTSSSNPQKNYKITLNNNSDGWRGQRTIALNKHMGEGLRFRNKLAYDLMSGIPQIMSLRTQFVHLYVRDTTGSNPDVFQDYGLYTQVEQLNRTALKAHGLDKNGYLYKVNDCEFYEYDALRLVDDPAYDEAAFNELLETKGRSDHTRLLEMIRAVNDYSLSSDDLLDRYFDRENLAYWMAFMILTGNADTQCRNFYIYSPLNGNKWYIYPWDNDGMLRSDEREIIGFSDAGNWERGISNYWGNIWFRRALLSESFRQELDSAVRDLMDNYLTEDVLRERAAGYAAVTKSYLYQMPDVEYAPLTAEEFDTVTQALPDEIRENYEAYQESLQAPMPFFVGLPVQDGGTLHLSWDDSFSFDNSDIRYQVTLARDYQYQDVLFETVARLPQCDAPLTLTPGQYFLHVNAVNDAGKTQNCFDYYTNTEGKVYGTYCFFVGEDGGIYAEEQVEGDV